MNDPRHSNVVTIGPHHLPCRGEQDRRSVPQSDDHGYNDKEEVKFFQSAQLWEEEVQKGVEA